MKRFGLLEITKLEKGHRAGERKDLNPRFLGCSTIPVASYEIHKKICQHFLRITSCMCALGNDMGMLIYNPTKMVTVFLNTIHKFATVTVA